MCIQNLYFIGHSYQRSSRPRHFKIKTKKVGKGMVATSQTTRRLFAWIVLKSSSANPKPAQSTLSSFSWVFSLFFIKKNKSVMATPITQLTIIKKRTKKFKRHQSDRYKKIDVIKKHLDSIRIFD